MRDSEITLEDVRRVQLKAGDVLVLRLPSKTSVEQIKYIRTHLRERFPDNEVMVLAAGVEVEVVSQPEPVPA